MKDFAELLADDVADYNGRHENFIIEAASFYRLMTNMLDDPELPDPLRPRVLAAVAYFVIAADIIPEELLGPAGYIDDIYLCALTADAVRRELKSDDILARNWEGSGSVAPLLQEILTRDQDLLGGKRDQVLQYAGFEVLKKS